jgi:Ca2+-binding RTX toxin-like protein
MRLQFRARVTTGEAALDTAIRAVTVAEVNGATLVYAATGAEGGLSVYRLGAAGGLSLHDSAGFAPVMAGAPARDVALAWVGEEAVLLLGAGEGGLMAHGLAADGTLGQMHAPVPLDPGAAGAARLDYLPGTGGGGMLALAGGGLYAMDGAGGLAAVAAPVAPGDPGLAVALLQGQAGPVLLRATPDGIVDAATGGAAQGFGVAAPTAVEAIAAHGAQFAIVGGAGSHSLTVLERAADGGLVLRDHLIDSRFSRFADLQDIAVAQVAGQVFVVAGGSDDGLSLLTLLPDGRLIHLDTIASAAGARLDGITRLAMAQAQDALQIVAATEGNPGLAHLAVATGNIGAVLRGAGTLSGGAGDDLLVAEGAGGVLRGGAGDDILVAGPSGGTLSGGAGADLFVMRAGGGAVRITDFDPAQDRLDLSDYMMLRSPDQLSVTSVPGGARIAFRDEVLTLDSHDGRTLGREDLFGRAFEGPDRITLFTAPDPLPPDPPPPDPDPPPPDPPSPPPVPGTEGARLLQVRSGEANPWLAGADILFTPEGAPTVAMQADAEGRFDLGAVAGTSGHLQILRAYGSGDPAFGVADALDVLRLAVGLAPSFGPATPADLLAADLDRDGTVRVDDALDVLRLAVGLPVDPAPEWLFLDPQADLAAVVAGEMALPEGVRISVAEDGAASFWLTAILPGNLDLGL